jgi:Erythromycin esterase
MRLDPAIEVVQREALWFEPTADGMGPLVEAIGDARLVLIGEATYGTDEFYRTRAELTKVLISRKGFNLVAVEADWPDAYRVNRWVRHAASETDAEAALDDFTRFCVGCGATAMWSSSWSGSARITRPSPRPYASASMDSICTAFTHRSTPCWRISVRSTPKPQNGAISIRLPRRFRRGPAGVRIRGHDRAIAFVRGRRRGPALGASPARG